MTDTPRRRGPDTLMCVGGPLDGKRFAVPHGERHVRFTEPVPLTVASLGGDISETVDFRYVTYERVPYRAGPPMHLRDILVPAGTDPGETLDRLIDNYRPERRT